MKTDTPETDAHQAIDGIAHDHLWREFARKLERERNALSYSLGCPSEPADRRLAKFGELMWERLLKILPEYLGEEESQEVMEIAEQCGLCVWTRYDPEIHGYVEDAEEGGMIWFWGGPHSQMNAKANVRRDEA